ncbi:MAG: hypothetical protein GY726_15845, partial [Proteobacteria bacterium]|nr:hypothetical protein [Pseudomonadota bacterium]
MGLPPEKPEAPSMLMGKQARALFKDDRFEASNEQQRVIELLQQKPGTKDRGGSISGAVVKAMSSWISGVLRNPDNQQQATGGGHQQEEPAKRSFKDFLAHHIMLSRLGAFLGRRQAKYLNKMMDMFDQGNLDQALRYAIPLSDLRDALNEQTAALGKPSARDSLDINQNRSQSSGTIFLADQMEKSLRELYERHFRNLDRLGRHKEAAFILAELLREYDRAVDYLEKHGEKRLAAELAEGQQLHPAKVIKQWMVAGDKRRAIQVARLSNCYAEALSVLEKWDKKAADQLRREFAEIHARAGCFEVAVEIIWPLRQEHEEMVQWARIAVDQGGGAGARMLAKYLSIAPDPENEYLLKAQMLLNNRGR